MQSSSSEAFHTILLGFAVVENTILSPHAAYAQIT
jgi:hypothetical protein